MTNMIPNRKEKGFTLIELVMVIVILGILAAFALPRFADLGGDARASSIQGVYGAARSANSIVRSACLASADCNQSAARTAAESVTLEGEAIPLAFGYPTAAGIITAAQISTNDFDITPDPVTAGATSVTIAATNSPAVTGSSGTCQVTYAEATGTDDAPDIGVDDSNC